MRDDDPLKDLIPPAVIMVVVIAIMMFGAYWEYA